MISNFLSHVQNFLNQSNVKQYVQSKNCWDAWEWNAYNLSCKQIRGTKWIYNDCAMFDVLRFTCSMKEITKDRLVSLHSLFMHKSYQDIDVAEKLHRIARKNKKHLKRKC